MYCRPFGEDLLALCVPVVVKAQPKSPVLLSVYLVLFELWKESRPEIERGLGSSRVKVATTNDCELKHFFVHPKLLVKVDEERPPPPLRFVFFMDRFAKLA